ncbi:MAG: hypothetical protein KGM24_11715 [Elusimicrobia bacterium]|nr:hypothetical protein [Elusimicrobiota bacterium]
MIAAAAACALLVAAPLSAAPSQSAKPRSKPAARHRKHHKPRPLTWERLAERVVKEGVDSHPLRAPTTRNLGYDADVVPTKAVRYTSKQTPDGWEYDIYVVTSRTGKPAEIVVAVTKVRTESKARYLDGFNVRFTPSGRILGAMRASGFVGRIVQTPLLPSEHSVRDRFESIQKMLLLKMTGVPFDK